MKINKTNHTVSEILALKTIDIIRYWFRIPWPKRKGKSVLIRFTKWLIYQTCRDRKFIFYQGHQEGFKLEGSLTNPRIFMYYMGGGPKNDDLPTATKLIPIDGVVFDIGANLGTHSLYYATKIVPQGKVWSFEPASSSFTQLERNIELNNLKNISISKQGLSDKNHQLRMGIPSKSQHPRYSKSGPWGITDGLMSVYAQSGNDSKGSELCDFVTLDSFVDQNQIDKIEFIKIDVEGHELAVLQGGIYTLSKFRPLIQIEINAFTMQIANIDVEDLITWIETHNYNIIIRSEDELFFDFDRKLLTDGTYAQGPEIPYLFNALLVHNSQMQGLIKNQLLVR